MPVAIPSKVWPSIRSNLFWNAEQKLTHERMHTSLLCCKWTNVKKRFLNSLSWVLVVVSFLVCPIQKFRLIYFRLYLYCMTECPIFSRSSYFSSKDVINKLELAIGTPAALSASTHKRSAHLQWIWLCEYPNAEANDFNLFFVCASLITYIRQFDADPKLSTNSYRQFYRPPLVDTACPELWQA